MIEPAYIIIEIRKNKNMFSNKINLVYSTNEIRISLRSNDIHIYFCILLNEE